MRVAGVGTALDTVEGEIDADRLAGVSDGFVNTVRLAAIAEFRGDVIRPRHAAFGHIRIQLKRPPGDLGLDFRPKGECLFEAALADEAPGADDVGNDVDSHGGIIALSPLPCRLNRKPLFRRPRGNFPPGSIGRRDRRVSAKYRVRRACAPHRGNRYGPCGHRRRWR